MMTILKIAELAGVSKSTVSRVLNNNGYVNDETRRRIEQIIKDQDYTPSAAAVSLKKQETNTIGVVIPEIDNSFFGEVIKGITEEADKNDFSIICCDTQNNGERELRALRTLEQQRVRGVIITPALGYGELPAVKKLKSQLEKLDVPIVVVDRDFQYSIWDTVYYENFQSGYLATKALIESGNKKIGFLQGDMNLKIAKERFEGYTEAMNEAGLKINQEDILPGNFSVEVAYELCKDRLGRGELPEGLVTANNRSSLGFLKAATELGLKLSEDICVVGIDHIPTLDILGIPFSTVSRDTEEMGRNAVKLLRERMEHPDNARRISMIPCRLELKGSEKFRG
ncbi:MAG: LacI family DNA-binding transcriptional regulator [Lachnospiraceae bacterium]|nr:LacI family DNA-binding transcriptional regulator [Lachnospiraceae bacterium]